MNKYPVVITSIYPASPAIQKFIKLGHTVILIGDVKTPATKNKRSLLYYSVADQKKHFGEFAKKLPLNHYARKNIGYLLAMHMGNKAIIETDDDNFPYDFFHNFSDKPVKTTRISSENHFVNTYRLFSQKKNNTFWPRGFPFSLITAKEHTKSEKVQKEFVCQQSLTNQDSDFDAVYRLTNNAPALFKANAHVSLAPHTYAPINSQNTFWKEEAFVCMYLPGYIPSRVCDIFRGYIAQRLLWEMGETVLFLSPSMYQKRNPHDYLLDFKEEEMLYKLTEKLIHTLETVVLTGKIENKMLQVYRGLIKAKLLPKEELQLVNQWIKEVTKISLQRRPNIE